jgi:citrate synthase
MTEPRHAGCPPELHSAAGIALLGQQVIVHGRDLHHECRGLSFVHYLLFCVTGRVFEERQARAFEQLWVSTGYPDARIWCNRIAGYLGSARVDPGLAMSAALAATNSVNYGFRAMRHAYAVQRAIPVGRTERACWLEQQLAERQLLSGYGRPIHGSDERLASALATLIELQITPGPALKRAHWLDRQLRRSKGIEMNIAAFWAALAIDFGIASHEYDAFMLLMFAPGYMAVYAEQRARPPFSFLSGYQSYTEQPPTEQSHTATEVDASARDERSG